MRRTSLPLLVGLVGLTLSFAVNCGSVTGDGTGTGGNGTGGDHATGGTGGSGTGGDHATGGSGGSGTGGDHATGGAGGNATGGTGGHATGGAGGHATGGTGGSATGGAGGHATGGAGGHATGGAGGHATGGAGGGGGHATGGQGGGESCTQLSADYVAARPAALACTPGVTNQCQTLMPITLGICAGCTSYVNDATALKAIQQQWNDQGCGNGTVVCPAIACVSPGIAGNCVATDGAAPGGVCNGLVATPLSF